MKHNEIIKTLISNTDIHKYNLESLKANISSNLTTEDNQNILQLCNLIDSNSLEVKDVIGLFILQNKKDKEEIRILRKQVSDLLSSDEFILIGKESEIVQIEIREQVKLIYNELGEGNESKVKGLFRSLKSKIGFPTVIEQMSFINQNNQINIIGYELYNKINGEIDIINKNILSKDEKKDKIYNLYRKLKEKINSI